MPMRAAQQADTPDDSHDSGVPGANRNQNSKTHNSITGSSPKWAAARFITRTEWET